MRILHGEGVDTFESKPTHADNHSQTQGQQQSIASMYNEADRHTPDCQSVILAPDIYDADSLSCDIESTRVGELTAWGSALAGLHNESTGDFNNYLPDARSQVQTHQHSTASMLNEADRNVPNYQSAILWQSQPYQGHFMDSPAIEMCDDNLLSWDTVSTQVGELSAWGCALAGIGAHLVDYRYQKYTNGEELTIE
jgi:hypothetical protein